MAGDPSQIQEPNTSSNSFTDTTVISVGYVSILIVSSFMLARIALQFMRPRKLAIEDLFMFFAYLLSVAQCALYITSAPVTEKLNAVVSGTAPPYDGMLEDGRLVGELYLPALLFYWTLLWMVKVGLLVLYRKLIVSLPMIYIYIWWVFIVFCGLSLIGNYVAFLMSCESLSSLFGGGGCDNIVRQFISIWYSYSADTITNIMLIAFPLHLMWNLQMPRGQKIALMVLFASGVVCIFIATLRSAVITANTLKSKTVMDGTWLGVWGMIEGAVAVVIGLCPAFAILIRAGRNPSKKAKYNSGGYIKQDGQSFKLHTIGSSSTRGKNKRIAHGETDLIWTEVNGSQEELAGKPDGISISTTIHQDAESVAGAK